jgi:flavin reductase (DIM6/NTAB) family NADH-FMN oxidoreductase RutF
MTEADHAKPWAAALGRIPSGLFILTARRGTEETGMLASWVQQCAFDPPLIVVALRRGRTLKDWLAAGDAFVVNILDDSQTDMIAYFGRGVTPAENALNELPLERTPDGTAILSETLAFLDCRVESSILTGDHDLVVCRVVGGRMLNEGQPMVHIRKSGLHY